MPKKSIVLIFTINGEDTEIKANTNQPLSAARNKALAKSDNTGRPFDDWEIRDQDGVLLPPEKKIHEFNFEDGQKLFLSLK